MNVNTSSMAEELDDRPQALADEIQLLLQYVHGPDGEEARAALSEILDNLEVALQTFRDQFSKVLLANIWPIVALQDTDNRKKATAKPAANKSEEFLTHVEKLQQTTPATSAWLQEQLQSAMQEKPELVRDEIAKLAHVSCTTVHKILHGELAEELQKIHKPQYKKRSHTLWWKSLSRIATVVGRDPAEWVAWLNNV